VEWRARSRSRDHSALFEINGRSATELTFNR
jgi:hypothetical protein